MALFDCYGKSESNRNDTLNLFVTGIRNALLGWQERENVTFLSISIGTVTWLLLTAFLNNLLIGTIMSLLIAINLISTCNRNSLRIRGRHCLSFVVRAPK